MYNKNKILFSLIFLNINTLKIKYCILMQLQEYFLFSHKAHLFVILFELKIIFIIIVYY